MWMSRMVSPREDDMGDALVGTALVGAMRPVSKKKVERIRVIVFSYVQLQRASGWPWDVSKWICVHNSNVESSAGNAQEPDAC